MDLFILRHGIAEVRGTPTPGDDSQRRLTADGITKLRRAARGMRSLELDFDLILTSPFLRASETAEIVADVFGLEQKLALSTALVPDGNPKELLDLLKKDYRKRKRILLVGHEPYLSRLISLLISGDTAIAISLKKGGLCKLSSASLHYGRCATLEWLLTPSQMRSIR
jgi:phosphohistidine phosphatase